MIVYKHTKKNSKEVFYIGIGKDETRSRVTSKRSDYWNNIVKKYGYDIEILFTDLTIDEACEKEVELIKKYGRRDLGKGSLVNLTDGGEGPTGHKHSEETKMKIGEASKKRIYKKGYKHSEEAKKKIAEANRNRSEETRQKLKTRLGTTLSEELKKKISKSNTGLKRTEEQKKRISAASKEAWRIRKLNSKK